MAELTIATNNGDVGGGEVMLLNLALAAADLGVEVRVVAPSAPSGLLEASLAAGLRTVEIAARDRRSWMRGLRSWDASHRRGVLWCNGLVPATATSGHPGRIVHLHQRPRPSQRPALSLARRGALRVLVPSGAMAAAIPQAHVFPNWTVPIARVEPRPTGSIVRVGFLGRHSPGKGLVTLARALALLDQRRPGGYRLWLAGEPRLVSRADQREVIRALAPVDHLVDRPGWVSREEFFGSVDVAAFPSHVAESFGLVAAEAMAAGVPLVISDAGGLPEVAGPEHRWIVGVGDADALADAIGGAAAEASPASLTAARLRWERLYSPDAGRDRLTAELDRWGLLPRTGAPT
ncbi:MAG: glycosyltransferase family 4 protein [Propioniciclava sp.]